MAIVKLIKAKEVYGCDKNEQFLMKARKRDKNI